MSYSYSHCGALHWLAERSLTWDSTLKHPKFHKCCNNEDIAPHNHLSSFGFPALPEDMPELLTKNIVFDEVFGQEILPQKRATETFSPYLSRNGAKNILLSQVIVTEIVYSDVRTVTESSAPQSQCQLQDIVHVAVKRSHNRVDLI